MCNRLHLLIVALGAAATACGGDLMLPVDGSPVALRAVSGGGQEATVGRDLPQPLVVRLTDASARPVFGANVVFNTDTPDAEIAPTIATTDSAGLASARVRLGTTTGPQTVEARVVDAAELRATFGVTALAQEDPDKGKGGKGRGRGNDHDDDDD